jgi:hypothetical protein
LISAHQSEIQGAKGMGQTIQTYDDDWDAQVCASTDAHAVGRLDASPPDPAPAQTRSPRDQCKVEPWTGTNTTSASVAVPHKGKPRNFPGFIARSALFRVTSSDEPFGQPTVVKAQGCSLIITGPKLGMRDKHVWETAIQLAKERAAGIGDAFEIELRDFARRMGSSNQGGRALASIWDSLDRLAQCRVQFELGESWKGTGSLLATAHRKDGRLYLRLNPDFAIPALMGDKQFLFDQARRSTLSTSLAQWLHDFFSTHKQSREMDLLYLRSLCGYDGPARNFPAKLELAMKSLVAAAPTLVETFEIERIGRNSDSWKLRVALGSEKPAFLPAEQSAVEPRGPKGRGRVAL